MDRVGDASRRQHKLCCIVGAGDMAGTELNIPEGAYVIAADAGLTVLESRGICPDLIVGDFDSLGRIPEGDNVLCAPAEKDDTDILLAVKTALEMGYRTLIIYGGLGGRLDHSLANLQILNYITSQGAIGFLAGCGCVCTVIRDASLRFSPKTRGTVSVFSMGDIARGVTLTGMKYPLTDYDMSNTFPIGVSNEMAGNARVTVKNGTLAVIWQAGSILPDHVTISREINEVNN